MVVDLSRERDRAAWYCLRTESKREHVAAANIRTQVGVEVYCPRVSYHKMTRRGKVRFTEAMFPGYIFVRCEIFEAMRHLLAIGGVISVVRYGSDIPAVPAEFVEELKARLGSAVQQTYEAPEPWLGVGTEVVVTAGPFLNFEAVVSGESTAIQRVSLLLDFLGRQIELEMPVKSILPRKGNPRMDLLAVG